MNAARSRLLTPGPRRMLRPDVPKLPAAGCANAAVLNHCVDVWLPTSGSPTRSARLVPNASLSPPRSAAVTGDREPPLPGVDAVQLPATDHRVFHPGRVTRDPLAAADRQVVDEAAHETVIHVEVRQAVIALRILVVQEALPAVEIRRADAGRGGLGVGALGPGIRKRQQRAAAAVLQLRVEGVVVRPCRPSRCRCRRRSWETACARPPSGAPGVRQRLRDVAPHQQIRPLRADVVDFERRVRDQLALHSERPLLHVGVSRLGRLADREERVRGRRRFSGAAKLGNNASGSEAAWAARSTGCSCRGSHTDRHPPSRRSRGLLPSRRTRRSPHGRRSSRRRTAARQSRAWERRP